MLQSVYSLIFLLSTLGTGPGTEGPGAEGPGPRERAQGPGPRDQGPGIRNQEPGAIFLGTTVEGTN